MTDRELLELAAKAAGIPAYWSDDGSIQQRPIFVVKAGGAMGAMPYECPWNPLTDDADALRLAVRLRMTVRHDDVDACIAGCWYANQAGPTIDGIGPWFWKEWNGNNPTAATRRAIVRAAAEIGKAMP